MFDASDFDKQRIDAIVGIVSERLVRRKTISERYTSYKIKNLIEYQEEAVKGILGGYVSNGELIYAMILAGYDVCRDGDSKNAFFNVSTESVEKLELTKFKPYMMSKALNVHISSIVRHCNGRVGNNINRPIRKYRFEYVI